jgi:orotidine-5'-phosphate decarboxylase
MKALTPAERLIVAADFKPDRSQSQDRQWVYGQVSGLARKLSDVGCYIKVNSAMRMTGYRLIPELHSLGLKVFADLKLFDIGETLATDGALLSEVKPDLLTVSCAAGSKAIKALKAELPDTEILGVTVLTSLTDGECMDIHGASIGNAARRLVDIALEGGVDGLICSAAEAAALRVVVGPDISINTPAIRPSWAIVKGDDQNPERIMTPTKAIVAGADRIVVGRPIVRDSDPRSAADRTIEEIHDARDMVATVNPSV